MIGYADVKVIVTDINDNAPRFLNADKIGKIEENRDPGGRNYRFLKIILFFIFESKFINYFFFRKWRICNANRCN